MPWLLLIIAILAEIMGTLLLKASDGFSQWLFGGAALLFYGVAFFLLAIVLQTIPVGIAYAIWSGVGVAAVTLISWVLFDQKLDLAAVLGIAMIVGGVVVLQIVSGSSKA
ncbi:MAG: multidrug efflux SMR transporter [Mangrovicoccus sp.]|nr:multidrug efflux SMR transporter [Mangrovicoccus sp.]